MRGHRDASAWRAVALCVLLAVSVLAATGAADEFVWLLFPLQCLRKHGDSDAVTPGALISMASDMVCVKRVISKVLGYGIIMGACIVKIPQILRFVMKGSVAGVSYTATYLDAFGYVAQVVYHVTLGSPWSAYGEAVIIMAQSIGIILMMWAYQWPGAVHVGAVSVLFAVITQGSLSLPRDALPFLQWASTALFVASRLWQIGANVAQGSTGELSFITLFLNFAGSAARIFTSSQEVRRPEVLVSFTISTLLNLTLVLQYVYYAYTRPAAAPTTKKQAAAAATGAVKQD